MTAADREAFEAAWSRSYETWPLHNEHGDAADKQCAWWGFQAALAHQRAVCAKELREEAELLVHRESEWSYNAMIYRQAAALIERREG